ncbi:MAG: CotH kinase family protein [Oribacterium sp.]|nr:CotH kinase family protein [Oribacterium sp.]
MIKKPLHHFVAFLACICVITACSNKESASEESSTPAMSESLYDFDETNDEPAEETEAYLKAEPHEEHLYDDKKLYKNQDDYSVITMYLTVSKGNTGDSSRHTWEEVNKYSTYDYKNAGIKERYKVEGLLQIDETGNGITENSFGYDETIPNVSVQVRGQTSSMAIQKNYKIRIKDGRGEFRGQRTLNLNKHRSDVFRFANKMSYDLANSIPELIAGRTQFVHLYVKDTTSPKTVSPDNASVADDKTNSNEQSSYETDTGINITAPDGYEDYGLFTMVEQVNRTYLRTHGFDENGQLYKVTFFEWNTMDELMIDEDDPSFDQSKFDDYLESKVNNDHSNLRDTLTALQNYSIPIDQILEEHFDVENMMYFLAFNILNGNADVGARNLFLYSPLNSKKIYFICWDMDNTFMNIYRKEKNHSDALSWERGMTKYLGLTLVNRLMKEQRYRDMLSDAVEDLYQHYITPDIVQTRALKYANVVEPYVFSMPDLHHAPVKDPEQYEELVSRLGEEVENNYNVFKESMKWPWPFFIGLPIVDYAKNETIFTWTTSYNYGEDVTYDLYVSTDYYFENILYEEHDLTVPIATTQSLAPGTYYLKVTSTGKSGYTMDCFDYFSLEDGDKCYGCYCFIINKDGTVINYEEENI